MLQISVLINGDFELGADRTSLSNQAEGLLKDPAFLDKVAAALKSARRAYLDQPSVFGKLMDRIDKDRRASNSGAMAARDR